MNDIVSYHIINPWSKNIQEIADRLIQTKDLKIIKSYTNYGVIHLIGKNDLGTTYEIGIWTTVMAQWARWAEKHQGVHPDIKKKALEDALKKQKEIDKGFSLR